jgi:O6-methylguanine-DNA--protein-cysteine methyltransferase
LKNLWRTNQKPLFKRRRIKALKIMWKKNKKPLVQKGKGKGIKRPLERKDETFVKDFEEPMIRNEETPVQRKKNKSKAIKEPDEVDKTLPMQEEEEFEKNPIETVHAIVPPDSQTYKRLIKQLRDARKEIARLKEEDKVHLAQMKELMDGYSHNLDLARFAARKAQPLHRQLNNLYR